MENIGISSSISPILKGSRDVKIILRNIEIPEKKEEKTGERGKTRSLHVRRKKKGKKSSFVFIDRHATIKTIQIDYIRF